MTEVRTTHTTERAYTITPARPGCPAPGLQDTGYSLIYSIQVKTKRRAVKPYQGNLLQHDHDLHTPNAGDVIVQRLACSLLRAKCHMKHDPMIP